MLKKIVIIGPESTGKSTLCEQLAAHFKTEWVPEYARQYLIKNGAEYNYNDLLTIAKGQLALEDNYTLQINEKNQYAIKDSNKPQISNLKFQSSNYLFIDTDMYVMKVWCEYVFSKCHPFILNEIATRKYDLYLLCNTDLPWIKDELREYPDLETRKKLYKIYRDILINQNTPWIDVKGDYGQRLTIAINAVEKFLTV